MPRGAKRFEVSSHTIHFASSPVMELLLFPHSIPVPLALHFISFVNSEVIVYHRFALRYAPEA